MVFQLNFRRARPIQLIIKDNVIRYLEIKQTNPFVVQSFGERYLPANVMKDGNILDMERLSLILEECVEQWKISRRKVYFHVPDTDVVIRKIPLPDDVPDDEVDSYLHMEIGMSIHLPFEAPVFDYHIIVNEEENREVILFVTKEETVNDYIDLLQGVNLVPIVADISSLSLYRLYDHFFQGKQADVLLIVEFDVQAVNVCIFEKQFSVFMRHIKMEVDMEKWELSSDGKLQYNGDLKDIHFSLEDMYKEIARVMDFYRYTLHHGKQQVTQLFLSGEHPCLAEIEKEMNHRLNIPIVSIDANKITTLQNNTLLPKSFHCAAGLGLKGV